MRLWMILFLACSCLGLGCVTNLDHFKYDNPQVRRLQDIESRKHLPDTETWLQLTNYVGARVGIIGPAAGDIGAGNSFSELLGGRGAALTSDGYFVTAFHVVKGNSFYLHETRYDESLTKPGVRYFEAGELDALITRTRSQGRLVWHDDELDLALVKFNIGALHYFEHVRNSVGVGDVVFSADDKGAVYLMEMNGESRSDGVGNGPFAVAGKIEQIRVRENDEGGVGRILILSLVGRGGMSGAPIVSERGEVVGVLTKAHVSRYTGRIQAQATKVDADFMRELIAADRAKIRN